MSNGFDTRLSPAEEIAYQQWLKSESKRLGRDISLDEGDYDVRGFWKHSRQTDVRGHGPDTYKKPNHPTFSNESIYHGAMSPQGWPYMGGQWGNNSYTPSTTMLRRTHNWNDLQNYFAQVEPGVQLMEPFMPYGPMNANRYIYNYDSPSTPMGAPAFPAAPPSGGMGQPGVPSIFPEQAAPQMAAQGQPLEVGNPFMRFLHTQNPQDLALAAAIFSSSFTQPQQALQWAMQVRNMRQQQQQQMAMKEWQEQNIRERQKEAREFSKEQKRIQNNYRLRMEVLAKGLDTSDAGPPEYWDEMTTAQFEEGLARINAREGNLKEYGKVLQQVAKNGRIPAKYAEDEMMQAAKKAFDDKRKAREEDAARRKRLLELAEKRDRRDAAREGRAGKKEQREKYKVTLNRIQKDIAEVEQDIDNRENDLLTLQVDPDYLNAIDFFGEDNQRVQIPRQAMQKLTDEIEELHKKRQKLRDDENAIALELGEKPIKEINPPQEEEDTLGSEIDRHMIGN